MNMREKFEELITKRVELLRQRKESATIPLSEIMPTRQIGGRLIVATAKPEDEQYIRAQLKTFYDGKIEENSKEIETLMEDAIAEIYSAAARAEHKPTQAEALKAEGLVREFKGKPLPFETLYREGLPYITHGTAHRWAYLQALKELAASEADAARAKALELETSPPEIRELQVFLKAVENIRELYKKFLTSETAVFEAGPGTDESMVAALCGLMGIHEQPRAESISGIIAEFNAANAH